MLRDRQNFWRRINLFGDLLVTQAALLVIIFYFEPDIDALTAGLLFMVSLVIWAMFLYGPSGSYFYRMRSLTQVLTGLYLALTKSCLSFVAIIFFFDITISQNALAAFCVLDAAVLTLSRIFLLAGLRFYRLRGRSNRNVIILGTGHMAKQVADRILDNKAWGLHIIGFMDYHRAELWRYRDIPLMGHPDGLAEIIFRNQVDFIIMAVDPADMVLTRHAFAIAEEMGVTVCLLPDVFFHPISEPKPTTFMDFPAVVYSSAPTDRAQLAMKSMIDRIGALVGVILSIPITLAAMIAIKLEDGGPVFFKQTRAGKNGKTFTMLKFRTMVPDAEKLKMKLLDKNEMSGPVFKIKNDPRITRIGALLRKTSIDELPQLFNILRGDMSLVGPRPPLPDEVVKYDRWQRRKLSVKPGLTCLWQVNGRNEVDFEDWMKLDLEYIDNWSLWLDTKILARTLPAVLKRNGAS